MKKVPMWIRKVILFTQEYPCADTRNDILNELISGNFDLEEHKNRVKNYCFSDNGQDIETFPNELAAINSGKKYVKMAKVISDCKLNK